MASSELILSAALTPSLEELSRDLRLDEDCVGESKLLKRLLAFNCLLEDEISEVRCSSPARASSPN